MTREVCGILATGRAVDVDSFADITTAGVESVDMRDGQVVVTFAADVPPDIAARVWRRISMTDSVEAAFAALEKRVTALEAKTANLTISAKGII